MSKKDKYLYNHGFKGSVSVIKQEGDERIKFNGIISESIKNGVIEKDLYSCQRVLTNIPKTFVRGENCSVIPCECAKKICERDDFCEKAYPITAVEFDGMGPSETSKSTTLKKNVYEYDRYRLNDDTLRKFVREKEF